MSAQERGSSIQPCDPASNKGMKVGELVGLCSSGMGRGRGKNGPATRRRYTTVEKLTWVKKYFVLLLQMPVLAVLSASAQAKVAAGLLRLRSWSNLFRWIGEYRDLKADCEIDPSFLGKNGKHKGGAGNKLPGREQRRGDPNGPWFEDEEAKVMKRFRETRRSKNRVSTRYLKVWMRQFVADGINPNEQHDPRRVKFQASEGWLRAFMKRNGLVTRKTTNKNSKSIMCLLPALVRFTLAVMQFRAANPAPPGPNNADESIFGRFGPRNTFNGDQVPLAFIEGAHRGTVEFKGAERVEVAQVGNGLDKRQASLQLIIRPLGQQPWPGLVLRRKKHPKTHSKARDAEIVRHQWRTKSDGSKERRPICVYWQEKAWVCSETAVESVNAQLKPILDAEKIKESLTLWDNLSSQRTDEFRKELSLMGATPMFGPAGATFLWQPVDHNVGARYHELLTMYYDEWTLGDECRGLFATGSTPSKERQRELLVDWVERAYLHLEAERKQLEEQGREKESIFYRSFARTSCLTSMTGLCEVDKMMKPEGVLKEIEDSEDPWYKKHAIQTYQDLVQCVGQLCDHGSKKQWHELKVEEISADKSSLAARLHELTNSDDARAVLLVDLLRAGYKWAGSSFITFLGLGLGPTLSLLAKVDANHVHLHDVDMYRCPVEVDGGTEELPTSALTGKGWEQPKVTDAFNVSKHILTFPETGARLALDLVTWGPWCKPGSDLFASLHLRWDRQHSKLLCGLFHVACAPPMTVSIHNALRYRQGQPVPCYSLREEICPTTSTDSTDDPDGRFRDKQSHRETAGFISCVPAWPSISGLPKCFSAAAKTAAEKKRKKKEKTDSTQKCKKKRKCIGKSRAVIKGQRNGKQTKDSSSDENDDGSDDELHTESECEVDEGDTGSDSDDSHVEFRVDYCFENPKNWRAPADVVNEQEQKDNAYARQVARQYTTDACTVVKPAPVRSQHNRPRRQNASVSYSHLF